MDTKTKKFIDKVKFKDNLKHKDNNGNWLYNYDKVIYKNAKTKVQITCLQHGDFLQIPNSHLNGRGCPKCSISAKLSNESFIKRAKLKHGEIYNYDKVVYLHSQFEVIINCEEHGNFMQTPSIHLQGSGCPRCGAISSLEKRTKNLKDFVLKAKLIHNNAYTYLKSEYETSHIKMIITCKAHGDFVQSPSSHLNGHGCPSCGLLYMGYTRTDFKNLCIKNNKGYGTLYIIRCFNNDESFYKIGITSRTTNLRYRNNVEMPYSYNIINEVTSDSDTIYNLEHKIFRQLSKFKYKPLISFGGETECFSEITSLQLPFK